MTTATEYNEFGLGKTRVQIELLRHAHAETGAPVLIICPLSVKHQIMHIDGPAMGITFEYVRNDEEWNAAIDRTPYLITNYERVRDSHISPELIATIGGVALDEAFILDNLGTETQVKFDAWFSETPYRVLRK